MPDDLEALQRELVELETQLTLVESQRKVQEQEEERTITREREETIQEWIKKQEKQRLLILKGQMDPFAWADGMYESLENL